MSSVHAARMTTLALAAVVRPASTAHSRAQVSVRCVCYRGLVTSVAFCGFGSACAAVSAATWKHLTRPCTNMQLWKDFEIFTVKIEDDYSHSRCCDTSRFHCTFEGTAVGPLCVLRRARDLHGFLRVRLGLCCGICGDLEPGST